LKMFTFQDRHRKLRNLQKCWWISCQAVAHPCCCVWTSGVTAVAQRTSRCCVPAAGWTQRWGNACIALHDTKCHRAVTSWLCCNRTRFLSSFVCSLFFCLECCSWHQKSPWTEHSSRLSPESRREFQNVLQTLLWLRGEFQNSPPVKGRVLNTSKKKCHNSFMLNNSPLKLSPVSGESFKLSPKTGQGLRLSPNPWLSPNLGDPLSNTVLSKWPTLLFFFLKKESTIAPFCFFFLESWLNLQRRCSTSAVRSIVSQIQLLECAR